MTTSLDVGDNYSITPGGTDNGVKGIPPWMEWNGGTVSGDAQLPSGYRRITCAEITLDSSVSISDKSVDIAPVTLPVDTTSQWRLAIYEPDGAYIIANGVKGIPTIGTPQVRLSRSAPTRAVVRFPLGHGARNVLGSLGGWSDGTDRPIARGMEMTVEYRDADSNSLMPVFRGRIFQIESGDTVTVTAYDRLMDLYQTTGQYLSHAGQTQGVSTFNRTSSGSDYIYDTGVMLGVLTGLDSINRLQINALGNMETDEEDTNDIIIHGLPTADGITPSAGDIITRIHTKISGKMDGVYLGGSPAHTCTAEVTLYATVYVFERVGTALVERARGSGTKTVYGTYFSSSATNIPFSITNNGQTLDLTLNQAVTVNDPSAVFIGIKVTAAITTRQNAGISSFRWGADRSSTRYTTSGAAYYRSGDGASWGSYTPASKPEVGLTFTHMGSSITPGLATISGGTRIVLSQGAIPAGPSGTYLTTEDPGVGLLIDYYEADKAPLTGIVSELLEAAGLYPEIGQSVDLGLVTLYTIVTTDYLTAIHEIIEARGYGLRDTVMDTGHIALLPEHTVDEAPQGAYTTAPDGTGRMVVLSHNLTVNWMAEKATVAYIAENATSSGLPLALETDDALLDGSLVEGLQAPLSEIVVDNTLGTHDMMANAAGGAIRRLHTNAIEGTVTLAGYRPSMWDIIGSGIGGFPITLDIPEYGPSATAVPTEIMLADGVTTVRLDNIRTQDRNGVARSMGLVEGSVSNDATLLPQTVYIFGRADMDNQIPDGETMTSLDRIILVREDGTYIQQTNANYLRNVTDTAGYLHLLAVFPEAAGTYTSISPVSAVIGEMTTSGGTIHITAPVEAKYIIDNQNIHVDLRLRNP